MPSKLRLNRETLRTLHHDDVTGAGGPGGTYGTCHCTEVGCLTKQDGTFCQVVTAGSLLFSCEGYC